MPTRRAWMGGMLGLAAARIRASVARDAPAGTACACQVEPVKQLSSHLTCSKSTIFLRFRGGTSALAWLAPPAWW